MTGDPFTAKPVFPRVDEARWREAAIASLKGGRFEDRLVARSYDGLEIMPVYTAADVKPGVSGHAGASPFVRGASATPKPWRIAQRIDLSDPAIANHQALEDLEGGAGALIIVAGRNGVRIDRVEDAEQLFAGIHLDLIALTLETEDEATERLVREAIARRNIALSDVSFLPGLAPLAAMARDGRDIAAHELQRKLALHHKTYAEAGHHGPLILLDARSVADALGSEGQEIASILSQGVAYLRGFEAAGIAPETALPRIAAKLAIDADQFLSIAKLRALRLAWSRLVEAMGLTPTPLDIRSETSWRMLSTRDPWVNMLRATIACFAAACGGADEIALHPFTSALGRADGLARRIARNTQAILSEESGLHRVMDPAGGSYYVESLTLRLAEAAWSHFQAIEQAGGYAAALRSGALQKSIADIRDKRLKAVATRRDKLTGVSEFPDINETPVAISEPLVRLEPKASSIEKLPAVRLSEGFEELRARAEMGQPRPSVFLANLGSPAETIARATFAKNFLEAGGLVALQNDGFADLPALITAFKASGTALACLCSTDAIYAAQGSAAAAALKAAGARLVILAGNPKADREALIETGVDSFIYSGMDVVAALTHLQRQIGL